MNCYFTALENEALLHLEGPDTATFLQGQLSCDIRELDTDRALPGLYCNPQGRVICDLLALQLAPGHIALRLRRELRASSAERLAKYIVFSKARLQAEREDWQLFACWGPAATAALTEVFGAAPQARYHTVRGEGYVLWQADADGDAFELLLEAGRQEAIRHSLAAITMAASAVDWEIRQIRAGEARIAAATSGEFTPQMLNYDLTGHISFRKGCYTGQEVVARLHYRGKPKRRLLLAGIEVDQLRGATGPLVAAPLYSPAAEQSVGNIVNAACTSDGEWLILATATAAGVSQGLHLDGPHGPPLRIGTLPYPPPE